MGTVGWIALVVSAFLVGYLMRSYKAVGEKLDRFLEEMFRDR